MAANITDLTDQTFDATIEGAGKPTLVDFWAPWCGPCKAIGPILEEIAGEVGDSAMICKVNVDENQEVARRFGVRAIPTMLFFRDGQKVDEVVGLSSKEDLKQRLS